MNLDATTVVVTPDGSSSLDNVLSLIKEANAVSHSINETIKESKPQFVFETCKPSKKKEESQTASTFVFNTNQQPTKKKKKKKNVKFAPGSKRWQVKYIDIPYPSQCELLYSSDAEQNAFVQEMLQDVEDFEQGRLESDDWTARGLEGSTEQGLIQHKEYRDMVWDDVLEEQDRQWEQDICDDMAIAWASLEATQEAREQAHLRGLQDQEEIYGEDYSVEQESDKECGLTDEDSVATQSTTPLEASVSSFGVWW